MVIKKKLFNTNIIINGEVINAPIISIIDDKVLENTNPISKKTISNKRKKMEGDAIKKKIKEVQKKLKYYNVYIKRIDLEKIIREYLELNELFFLFDVNTDLQKDFKEMFFDTKEKDLKLSKKDISVIKEILEETFKDKKILTVIK